MLIRLEVTKEQKNQLEYSFHAYFPPPRMSLWKEIQSLMLFRHPWTAGERWERGKRFETTN